MLFRSTERIAGTDVAADCLLQRFQVRVDLDLLRICLLYTSINHIPVRLTAEAVEPAVNLHAGMFVIMEGTAGHPIPADLHSVRSVSYTHLDVYKRQVTEMSLYFVILYARPFSREEKVTWKY